jgi:hypothetical protein
MYSGDPNTGHLETFEIQTHSNSGQILLPDFKWLVLRSPDQTVESFYFWTRNQMVGPYLAAILSVIQMFAEYRTIQV